MARFAERLASAGGELHTVVDVAAAAAAVGAILARCGARRVAFSDGADVADLRARLAVDCDTVANERGALLGCDAGVTQAQWGVAETGSLLLDGGAEQHRLASLLPRVHIALLRAERILPALEDALAVLRQPASGRLPACATLVTGPSRTADIELTLVVGVHGPSALHVVLWEASADADGDRGSPRAEAVVVRRG